MKIKKFKKEKNSMYQVTFLDDTSIKLHEDIILKSELLLKKEIDEKALKNLLSDNEKYELYTKCLKYLGVKMRSESEIRKKFKDYSEESISYAINRLKAENYLNDIAYIKAYINDSINLKLVGKNYITDNLTKLGYKSEIFMPILNEIPLNVWDEKIKKLVGKMIKSNHNKSSAELAIKITNNLLSKGFSKSEILSVLAKTEFKSDKEILEREYQKAKRTLERKYKGDELYQKLYLKLIKKGFNKSDIDKLKEEN